MALHNFCIQTKAADDDKRCDVDAQLDELDKQKTIGAQLNSFGLESSAGSTSDLEQLDEQDENVNSAKNNLRKLINKYYQLQNTKE